MTRATKPPAKRLVKPKAYPANMRCTSCDGKGWVRMANGWPIECPCIFKPPEKNAAPPAPKPRPTTADMPQYFFKDRDSKP